MTCSCLDVILFHQSVSCKIYYRTYINVFQMSKRRENSFEKEQSSAALRSSAL